MERSVTHATGVGEYLSMTKKVKKSVGLKAINDFVIVEEEPIQIEHDRDSGLTSEVVSAIKEGNLIIPDAYQDFAEKFPCRGKVISVGPNCHNGVKVGDKIIFARLGVQRIQDKGKVIVIVRGEDIHAVIES